MVEPLRIDQSVACPPAHAFATWVDRFGQWWPRSHTVSGDPEAIVLEPRPGGRIFERTPEGEEVDWGEITAWEPPRRLGYLWHLRADRADATDVEITFVPVDAGRTRVEIEHRGWERLGATGEERRDANRGGWAGLLPHFIEAANEPMSTSEEHT